MLAGKWRLARRRHAATTPEPERRPVPYSGDEIRWSVMLMVTVPLGDEFAMLAAICHSKLSRKAMPTSEVRYNEYEDEVERRATVPIELLHTNGAHIRASTRDGTDT